MTNFNSFKTRLHTAFFLLFLFATTATHAQNVGIGTMLIRLKQITLALLTGIILITNINDTTAQCTNTTKYPSYDIVAPQYLEDTVEVTNCNYAGEYYTIKNLNIGETYSFMSYANSADYLTIRDEYGGLLAHGTAPLSWTVSGLDIVNVHINLVSPPCGTDSDCRTTKVTCTTCPAIPPGVGVNLSAPQSDFDIGGILKIGNNSRPPKAGMIRWNGFDFEGYNGSGWISLTQANMPWGKVGIVESNENQKMVASDAAAGDKYGTSVGINGDYAIVGAPGKNSDEGGAYILKKTGNTWSEQAVLTAGGGATGNRFGYAVAIYGDYAVIGAPNYGANQGAAYVFHRVLNNWTQQAILLASDGYDNDDSSKGSAYVFHRTGNAWAEQGKLTYSMGSAGDNFGFSVDIEGDFALIGAPYNTGNEGEAYYFHRTESPFWIPRSYPDGNEVMGLPFIL